MTDLKQISPRSKLYGGVTMTHEADVKDRFIELRAEGLSYQRIA